MRLTALFLFLSTTLCTLAQEKVLRIGILRDRTFRNVLVMSQRGVCTVFADGERKGEIQVNDGLRVDLSGRNLVARSLNLSVTAKERIELVPRMAEVPHSPMPFAPSGLTNVGVSIGIRSTCGSRSIEIIE